MRKQKEIVKQFSMGSTEEEAAREAKVNINTANLWYRYLRRLISLNADNKPCFARKVQIDHAYFGGPQKRSGPNGNRAWSRNKIIVFGIYDRGSNTLYVVRVPNTKSETLIPIIKRIVQKGSYVYSDGWRGFERLKKEGYKLRTVNHSAKQFHNGRTKAHTGHIDSFWGVAKKRYRQLNGVPEHTFDLFLKECEFRFNHRATINGIRVQGGGDIFSLLLKMHVQFQKTRRSTFMLRENE